MPESASTIKKNAVKSYGADIHWCGNVQSEREKVLEEIQGRTGAYYIPPYDHPDIIAGQGTVALEMLEQISDLDAVVAPVGGGGLLAGVALTVKSLNPEIQVYGAEPLGADDAARSMKEGKRLPQLHPQTMADGLQTGLGEWNWAVIRDQVDGILTVEEQAIYDTTQFIWERMKQIVEPSGAVSLASVLSETFRKLHQGQRIGVVLSGGNVSLDFFHTTSNLDAVHRLG